ncbi:ribosomal RNA-processing protein 7 homolog A [Pararge aegeria]|uniref:Jg23997 protein n=2 Tax=Pararge aegeria TaxID=116150 RepID=A0A8S4SNF3_9NEOP|nr:ribosomal RNA-processing protein 7 homolog A [Pararge aegeria]CAH2269321.1 jg23997 [Pararge aegeria aegeria]
MKSTKRTHEFKALELKFNDQSTSPHTIYFKEHSVRDHDSDKPSGRTLFIINVPPYANEDGLKNAFSEAGVIISVIFNMKPISVTQSIKFMKETCKPSFKICYLVFKKVSELNKALELKKLHPLNSNDQEVNIGMKKWIQEYNNSVEQPKLLKERIETFMKEHDKKIDSEQKQEKQLEKEDDEGWVTVTKGGKVQSFARTDKVESKIMAKEESKKKRKELKNFYTFQIRESKMKHIVSLRQKFEEDKKKIVQIKQSRRFKPF